MDAEVPGLPGLRPVALDARGGVAEDVACVGCGYNLRTLAPRAVCPECGQTVARSLRRDDLELADPTWLATLRRGAGWSAIAGVLTILVGMEVIEADRLPVMLAVLLPGLAGVWLLSSSPADDIEARSMRRWRWAGRAGAVALIAILVGFHVAAQGQPGPTLVLLLAYMVAALVTPVAMLVVLRRLLARARRPRLRGHLTLNGIAWIVVDQSQTLCYVIILGLALRGRWMSAGHELWEIADLLQIVLMLIAGWSVVIDLLLVRAFGDARRRARGE